MLFWVENDIFLWIFILITYIYYHTYTYTQHGMKGFKSVYFGQQVQKTMFIFFNHDISRNPGWETLYYSLLVLTL
jgi:hypothetical protein